MTVEYGNLPFAEQVKFLRDKDPVLTAAWTDVYAAEHDAAFMVAGAAKADLLADLRAAVDKGSLEGGTIQQFRKDFDALVDKHGWVYNGGRNWRTRVIYETNLRQSYNAGREAQMADPALRKERPYGLYRHGNSAEPRPEHLALDGTVLPLSDPFWDAWSPSNGWGCTCRKLMVSAADVERMGLTVAKAAPQMPLETRTVGINGPSPRTVTVPRGIDPGFEYRPGATRLAQLSQSYLEKAAAVSPLAADSAARELATSPAFRRFLAAPSGDFALALLPEADAAALGAQSRVVKLSTETALKQASNHPELTAAEYQKVQEAISRGLMIQDTARSLIYVLEEPEGYVTVVKGTKSGQAVFLTSFRRLSGNEVKRSEEVRRLLKAGKKN